jgi:hypothetical protein
VSEKNAVEAGKSSRGLIPWEQLRHHHAAGSRKAPHAAGTEGRETAGEASPVVVQRSRPSREEGIHAAQPTWKKT